MVIFLINYWRNKVNIAYKLKALNDRNIDCYKPYMSCEYFFLCLLAIISIQNTLSKLLLRHKNSIKSRGFVVHKWK